MPVIGYLASYSITFPLFPMQLAAFKQGLAAHGYTPGQNVTIQFSFAEGHYDRLPQLAEELVRRQVAVIFAPGGSAPAQAAKAATATIPIVSAAAAIRSPVASSRASIDRVQTPPASA